MTSEEIKKHLLAQMKLFKTYAFMYPYLTCNAVKAQQDEWEKASKYPTQHYLYNLMWVCCDADGCVHMYKGRSKPVLIDGKWIADNGSIRLGNPVCNMTPNTIMRVPRNHKNLKSSTPKT